MINIDWRLQGGGLSFLYNYISKYVSVLPWKNRLMSLNTKSYPHKLRLEEVLEHSQVPRRWCEVWCQSTGFLPTQDATTLYPLTTPPGPTCCYCGLLALALVVMRWSADEEEAAIRSRILFVYLRTCAHLAPPHPRPTGAEGHKWPCIMYLVCSHVSCI